MEVSAVSAAIHQTARCQKTAVRTALPGKRRPTHEAGNNTNATNACRLATRAPERVADSALNIRTSSDLSHAFSTFVYWVNICVNVVVLTYGEKTLVAAP
jgi:hypothetical protein